jgi:tetratricopeptide (TPR) repeat protein
MTGRTSDLVVAIHQHRSGPSAATAASEANAVINNFDMLPDTSQQDLYGKIGDVQKAQGDLAGALKSYNDSLAIAERLAKADPGNAGWQRDLSASYGKIGDVQKAQGDLAGALKSYNDSLAIAERLAKADPGNAGWQKDLSVSYGKIGDVQKAQGDIAGALKSYNDSLAIAERLAKSDAGNAGWQKDLSGLGTYKRRRATSPTR